MSAADFPRDPVKFKTWADEACRAWPMELTAAAYYCWRALEGLFSEEYIQRFAAAYRAHVLSGSSA